MLNERRGFGSRVPQTMEYCAIGERRFITHFPSATPLPTHAISTSDCCFPPCTAALFRGTSPPAVRSQLFGVYATECTNILRSSQNGLIQPLRRIQRDISQSILHHSGPFRHDGKLTDIRCVIKQ